MTVSFHEHCYLSTPKQGLYSTYVGYNLMSLSNFYVVFLISRGFLLSNFTLIPMNERCAAISWNSL